MRKKGISVLCIAGLLVCRTPVFAASDDTIMESDLVQKLEDSGALACLFIGESIWNDEENFDDVKENASEMILDFLEEGIDMEDMTSEDLISVIDYAYEIGCSSDVLSISLDIMEEDSKTCRDAVQEVFRQQAMKSRDEDYLLMETGRFPEAALTYKDDWYGERTDDERIELADSILDVLVNADVETDGYNGNTLAQALNDRYDQDAGDSVLYLAFDILEEQEHYVTVVESILACLAESY